MTLCVMYKDHDKMLCMPNDQHYDQHYLLFISTVHKIWVNVLPLKKIQLPIHVARNIENQESNSMC